MQEGGGSRGTAVVPPPPPAPGGQRSSVRRRVWPERDGVFPVAGGGVICLSLPDCKVCIVIAILSDMVYAVCAHSLLRRQL